MREKRSVSRLAMVVVAIGFGLAGITRGQTAQPVAPSVIERMPGKKASDFLTFRPPSGRFSFEYPKKDWKVVPGLKPVAVQLVYTKDFDALVSVEHEELPVALSPTDITQRAAELESGVVRRRVAGAAVEGLQATIVNYGEVRVIVIEYTLASEGGPRRVRQYMMVNGKDAFRIFCSTSPGLFGKRDQEFRHMAATFLARARPAGSD